MTGDDFEEQIKKISEKMQKRDEEERKKAEQEWRKEMDRDTAGTTLKMFGLLSMQIANLWSQIDATNPLAPVARAVAELGVRMTNIEQAILAASKEGKQE